MISETIKNNEKITIEKVANGFEYGFIETRLSESSPWEGKKNFMRNLEPLWFSKSPKEILKNCGIETTERRAQDLSNLFDGTLNGYYYVRMASIDDTDEAAKLVLGYISETFNNRSISIMDINKHIPASWLRELLLNISTNKIPRKFMKDFIDEFIDLDDKSTPVKEFIDERLKDPKYETIDDSLIAKFVDIVFEKYPQAVIDAKQNPKKAGFLVGKVIQESDKKATPQIASALIAEKLKE